ncbi:hypothetical protein [Pendulispora albinea]|uniref:Uncharacterized protein n=1 Tax=Pendulispora albinea TaxID=2741071 RepID=A0ABZ2LYG1_9BACT
MVTTVGMRGDRWHAVTTVGTVTNFAAEQLHIYVVGRTSAKFDTIVRSIHASGGRTSVRRHRR